MKYIMRFNEEFTEETLSKNNREYDGYYSKYNDGSREKTVAWSDKNSQTKNFKMVSNYISNNDSILDYGCGIGDFIKHLSKNKSISDYLGVDINKNFINSAETYYPDNKFQLIKNVNDISGKWDSVCAIGVFTWFITKNDFIETINKLYEICNKQLLITCLYNIDINYNDENYWKYNYREYNEDMFIEFFPNLKIEFIHHSGREAYPGASGTMLVKINK